MKVLKNSGGYEIVSTNLTIKVNDIRLVEEMDKVFQELEKAEKKHPNWPKDNIFEQQCIIAEEAGEIAKAVWDYKYDGLLLDDVKHELRQTAAMCLRMLINLK